MVSERVQRHIERLLDEADEAVTARDWAAVRDRVEQVLTLDPDNRDAIALRAAAQRGLGAAKPGFTTESTEDTEKEEKITSVPSVSSVVQPASFASGRYSVVRFLGEGGKKRVFLAHDTLLDRDVAFALIKTEGLDQEGRRRITREAQAMAKLGDHPHIVPVFDMGEEGQPSHDREGVPVPGSTGQPYIVCQLMTGGDVEGLLEKAEGHRLPVDQALRIAQQVCQALQHAHDHDIVHRDLKPGNVWLMGLTPLSSSPPQGGRGSDGLPPQGGRGPTSTPELTAKIGDFGLAVALDRSRLTRAGMMVGTVAYMPPEQALGGEVEPRSDLYSLGCMLYEMVCGRPPFVGQDSIAIIGQHINTPPVAPSWHNPACPRALEDLVLRLLAKTPEDRPASAGEVLAMLQSIDSAAVSAAPEAGSSNPLDRLARGIFVDRAQELAQGRTAVDEAFSGRAGLLLLHGDQGIGKTRLAEEITTYASLRGAAVLWGASYRGEGAPAYWPWVQALRGYVRSREPAALRSELGSSGPEVARVVSEVREQLPDLPSPTPGDPAQERFRLFDAIGSFLRNAGASQPLVIVLDNVHFADHPSLLLMQFLLQESREARLLMIGTYRDVETGRDHPLNQVLAELLQERRFRRLSLKGLSREDTARMMQGLIGSGLPSGLADRVYEATEGVPLYVEEMVRLLAEEGKLDAAPASLAIPEGLRQVVGRRLDRLSEEGRGALTMAALVGREFDFSVLRELTGKEEDPLLELLEEAASARIIEEQERRVGSYRFVHGMTMQVLTADLSTTRRVRLHGRIGEALERVYGLDIGASPAQPGAAVPQGVRHAAELAYHFGQAASLGSATEKAVRYAVLAAQGAEATYAYEEAIRHYEAALAVIEDEGQSFGHDVVELRSGLARAQRGVYRMVDAFRNFRRAINLARERGDGARVGELTVALMSTGYVRSELRVQILIDGLKALPDPESETAALLHAQLAVFLDGLVGREQEGEQHRKQAEDQTASLGSQQADLWLAQATLLLARQNLQVERLPELDERLERLEAVAGRRVALWQGPQYRVLWPMLRGDREDAMQRTQRFLEYALRARNPYDVVTFSLAMAMVNYCSGALADAEREVQRAVEWSRGEPDDRIERHRSLLALARGDLQEARARRVLAQAMSQRINAGRTGMVDPASLAEIERRLGNATEADHAFRQAAELFSQGTLRRLDETLVIGIEAVAHGDTATMGLCEDYLAGKADLFAMADAANPALASVRRALGVMAAARGRWDEAVMHLERGVAQCREKGLPVELAHCRLALADALRGRDAPGDRDRSATLVDEALADFRRLGMPLYVQDALARREIVGA